MAPALAVTEYPWDALHRVSRSAVRHGRQARQLLGPLGAHGVAAALEALADTRVEVVVRNVRLGEPPPPSLGADVTLAADAVSAVVTVSVEPALAAAVLSKVLARPVSLSSASEPLDPVLRGCTAALMTEIGRRVRPDWALRVLDGPTTGAPLRIEATVVVDGRAFAARAAVVLLDAPTSSPQAPTPLAALGDLPISVPLVGAVAGIGRDELESLAVGDALMPGDGWLLDRGRAGRAVIAAPGTEAGFAVEVADDGNLVVRGEPVALEAQASDPMGESHDLTDTVLDAPVVVRVEIGAVSMPARDWASLQSGDVIETGRRIAEPVVLRVAGREVGKGELVNVEGEVGVRVREILGTEPREGDT